MANIKSAEKRMRQNAVRRARNRTDRSRMRTAIKDLRAAIDAGDGDKARELLPGTLGLVDSSSRRSILHRNAAARTKSRLTRAVAQLD
jgi:small subunit ribosomal protein S20